MEGTNLSQGDVDNISSNKREFRGDSRSLDVLGNIHREKKRESLVTKPSLLKESMIIPE